MYTFSLTYNYFTLECIVLINKMENGNVEDHVNTQCSTWYLPHLRLTFVSPSLYIRPTYKGFKTINYPFTERVILLNPNISLSKEKCFTKCPIINWTLSKIIMKSFQSRTTTSNRFSIFLFNSIMTVIILFFFLQIDSNTWPLSMCTILNNLNLQLRFYYVH